jgi:hypothetical protein
LWKERRHWDFSSIDPFIADTMLEEVRRKLSLPPPNGLLQLTVQITLVAVPTIFFNSKKTIYLSRQCMFVFRMVLIVNSDHFAKRH